MRPPQAHRPAVRDGARLQARRDWSRLAASASLVLLGLSQFADWFFYQGSRIDLGALARAHAFEIAAAALMALTLAVRLPGLTGDLGHVPLDIDENRLASNIQHYFVTGELVHTTVEHYPGVAFWMFSGASFLRFMRGLGAGLVTTPAHLSVTEFVASRASSRTCSSPSGSSR